MASQYCFCFVSVFDLMAVSIPLYVAKDMCAWIINITSHACCPIQMDGQQQMTTCVSADDR